MLIMMPKAVEDRGLEAVSKSCLAAHVTIHIACVDNQRCHDEKAQINFALLAPVVTLASTLLRLPPAPLHQPPSSNKHWLSSECNDMCEDYGLGTLGAAGCCVCTPGAASTAPGACRFLAPCCPADMHFCTRSCCPSRSVPSHLRASWYPSSCTNIRTLHQGRRT